MGNLATAPRAGPPADRGERMARQAKASKADATWAAYGSDWRVWATWAGANGVPELPADPEHVAAFLSDLSASRKVSTLRRYLASISVSHTLKGYAFLRNHASIKTILRGISRENARPVHRVKPLVADRLRAMLRDFGDEAGDIRDAALLALGVASGCRRSELACLDWLRRGEGLGVLELAGDEGAVIRLYRSKTDQEEPAEVHILPGLALAAVRRWAALAGLGEGTPLFRPVNKAGAIGRERLGDKAIARVVKKRCGAAGLEAGDFSGHSLRAGMITSAAEADVPEWKIKLHSRHRSDIVRQYIRPVEKRRHSPTKAMGL
jgi:integrase